MTRRSKREIEQALADIEGGGTFEVQDLLWANLKDYYDGHLSEDERRLLDDPEAHLSASAARTLRNRGGAQ